MNNNFAGFDLRAISDAVKENIRQFGGFSPSEVGQAGAVGVERLRGDVLISLKGSPKTGFELINAIGVDSKKPSSSQLYPLLEQLFDEGLLTSTVKKDRRVFALTASGEQALAGWQPAEPAEDQNFDAKTWLPTWVDLRGNLPKSLARLGKLSFEVSQHGSKSQQEEAAKAIDDAVKQLHKILSAE